MVSSITLRGRTVTRADVLEALAELDQVGKIRFLRTHGFRDSVRFHLRHDGRSYPSKAILGVASGLASAEFFGGASHAARQLAELGFEVRNSTTGALVDRQLDSLRRACEREGLEVSERPWPTIANAVTAYFASGSNRAPEIRGLSRAGADVGVAAAELTEEAILELEALAGSDVLVFVDSGAFSEVDFPEDGPPVVVRPMGPDDWTRVLALYLRLAKVLGSQVWLVAPDRVGCQRTSLERLELYGDQVRELRDLGARILVPVQKGDRTQAEFAGDVDEVLGFSDWIPALPCRKAATTSDEVAAFVEGRTLLTGREVPHVHLLGLGIRSRQLREYLAPFAPRGGRATSVSLDACWITANVGRTNGPKNGPRRLTRARDVAARILERLGVRRLAAMELAVYSCLAGAGLVASRGV